MRMWKNDVDSDNTILLLCYQSVIVYPELEFIIELYIISNITICHLDIFLEFLFKVT